MKKSRSATTAMVRIVLVLYSVIVLSLIMLAIVNYPVQWRVQVNHERSRYLQVFAQAIDYYYRDHDNTLPALPQEYRMISNTSSCSYTCSALHKTIACFDLNSILVPNYMSEILQDPLIVSDSNSGFYLMAENGGVRIGSCDTFFDEKLEVSKKY